MENNIQKKTLEKYLIIIDKLKKQLEINNSISMFKFCKENHISKNVSTSLQILNIIHREGRKWYWVAGDISETMVVDIIKGLGKLNPPRKMVKGDYCCKNNDKLNNDNAINENYYSDSEFEKIMLTFK